MSRNQVTCGFQQIFFKDEDFRESAFKKEKSLLESGHITEVTENEGGFIYSCCQAQMKSHLYDYELNVRSLNEII